jgi:quercetin dioxygenase-like cupin family protein
MQRKEFLLTTLAATPLTVLAQLNKKAANNPFKVEAGKSRFNEILTFRGINKQDIKVSKKDTNSLLSVLEYTGNEKAGPPLHIHYNEDEIFYITEGEYRFVVGTAEIRAKAGDTVFLPRNVPHTWIQLTQRGRHLYTLQPSGTFEEFLRALQALTKPPTEEELQAIHLKHGMKVLGPPLTI